MKKILSLIIVILIIYIYYLEMNTSNYKEFSIKSIRERELFGGLGETNGSIGSVTSIFITNSGNSISNYDFEIYEQNIKKNFKEKLFIKKINDSEIKICNSLNINKKCYNTNGTLVEKFIKNNGL